jgi:hypothetical protein
MSVDNLRNKGRDFWKALERVAESGKIPYVKVQSDFIPRKDLPFGRKLNLRPDPLRRFSHFRTRSSGGRGKPFCLARGCNTPLLKDQLLVCSPECLAYLKGSCEKILEILETQPDFVYTDFMKGMGLVRSKGQIYTEKDDELEGFDGNRYRGFSRCGGDGPGVGIVSREEIPSTHLLSVRNPGDATRFAGVPRVPSSPSRVRSRSSGAPPPPPQRPVGGGTDYWHRVDRSKR